MKQALLPAGKNRRRGGPSRHLLALSMRVLTQPGYVVVPRYILGQSLGQIKKGIVVRVDRTSLGSRWPGGADGGVGAGLDLAASTPKGKRMAAGGDVGASYAFMMSLAYSVVVPRLAANTVVQQRLGYFTTSWIRVSGNALAMERGGMPSRASCKRCGVVLRVAGRAGDRNGEPPKQSSMHETIGCLTICSKKLGCLASALCWHQFGYRVFW